MSNFVYVPIPPKVFVELLELIEQPYQFIHANSGLDVVLELHIDGDETSHQVVLNSDGTWNAITAVMP